MNAVTLPAAPIVGNPDRVKLELPGSPDMPRQLSIRVGSGRTLSVCVSPRRTKAKHWRSLRMMAFAIKTISECRIDVRSREPSLWVGSASFDLTAAEVTRVLPTLRALGVAIEDSDSGKAS